MVQASRMIDPYSPEFHITFGLHSGLPLCCVYEWVYGNSNGNECKPCRDKGLSYALHICGDHPACQPYLELVTQGTVDTIHKKADAGEIEIGLCNQRPLNKEMTTALWQRGYHLIDFENAGGTFYYNYSRIAGG